MNKGYGKSPSPKSDDAVRSIDTGEISASERYQLLTSLVVPRPIGWISTWGSGDTPNLAPFSYFEIITNIMLGYYFFGDFPHYWTWIGLAIIICSGIYISL